jgi:hypothetical protein
MNSTITATTRTTATATATDTVAYLNHWIRLNSGKPNAAGIASLALRGKRDCSRHWSGEPLRYPDEFILASAKMTPAQLRVSKNIAQKFGHLWASFDCPIKWADHFNNGQEDWYNSSQHPLPTPADQSASGRYDWEVNRLGTVDFKINRPSGTACRVQGTMTNFVITITKLCLDRHLVCLFQQLQAIFGLSPDEAIERIETAKGFALCGIRGGELHRVVMTA